MSNARSDREPLPCTVEPVVPAPMPRATEDSGARCVLCGYNLTGLSSDRCPECGWEIDWAQARFLADAGRPGTPAHRAKGWRRIDQTFLTIAVMLLTPWQFARQLRADESLLPSLCVALAAVGVCLIRSPFRWHVLMCLPAIGVVIIGQTLCFGFLSREGGNKRWARWWRATRLWLLFSFYSTCFVSFWPIADGPPVILSLNEGNVWTPFNKISGWLVPMTGPTIIYYWWTTILTIFFAVRCRPRWGAIAVPPFLYILAWLATWAGAYTGKFLGVW